MFLKKLIRKELLIFLFLTAFSFFVSSCMNSDSTSKKNLVIYTTTSVYDSGLLDYILKPYERESGLKIKIIAVGTGEALKNAEIGNADIVIVHSPKLEAEYMKKGVLKSRKVVAENFFVIAGPKDDPCSVRSSKDAVEAFKKIYSKNFAFVSRGDGSGTHLKELEIWERAGIDPKKNPNYLVSGSGMSDTLRIASEKQAYVLTDIATLLRSKGVDLRPLFYKDKALRNIYSVCLVSKKIIGSERYRVAKDIFIYLTSKETLLRIKEFSKIHSRKGYPEIFKPVIGVE